MDTNDGHFNIKVKFSLDSSFLIVEIECFFKVSFILKQNQKSSEDLDTYFPLRN